MSISTYALSVRNFLRSNLTNFYGGVSLSINYNCRVMLDEHPTANCGQEFISIYGSYHQPKSKDLMMALEEEFGLTVAVSRKIALVPPDYRGETGYLNDKQISIEDPDEESAFINTWKSTEARCREIVNLLQGSNRYIVMNNTNTLIAADRGAPFTEPLLWLGTDPAPKQVGPEFFFGYQEPKPTDDNVFGLVQKVYLGEAIRMQPIADLDRVPT